MRRRFQAGRFAAYLGVHERGQAGLAMFGASMLKSLAALFTTDLKLKKRSGSLAALALPQKIGVQRKRTGDWGCAGLVEGGFGIVLGHI